jgi:hypothetical protein
MPVNEGNGFVFPRDKIGENIEIHGKTKLTISIAI